MKEQVNNWLEKAKKWKYIGWLFAGIAGLIGLIFFMEGRGEGKHDPKKLEIDTDPEVNSDNNHGLNPDVVDANIPEITPMDEKEFELSQEEIDVIKKLQEKLKRKKNA